MMRPSLPPGDTSVAVYLVKSAGLYKIGISEDVARRVVNLRNASAVPVERVADAGFSSWASAREAEQRLHKRFTAVRSHGEWFLLTNQQAAQVARYLRRRQSIVEVARIRVENEIAWRAKGTHARRAVALGAERGTR